MIAKTRREHKGLCCLSRLEKKKGGRHLVLLVGRVLSVSKTRPTSAALTQTYEG